MKTKKQIVIVGIIMLIIVLLLPTISKANVEIKPDGTFWGNISISDAYQACIDMGTEGATTLGNHKGLQPHLALNKDWGAVAYLALSAYGTTRSATGEKTKDEKYYSTTTNMSGVMNFGANVSKGTYTYTSSMIKGVYESASGSEYRTNLANNASTKFVEILEKDANTNKDNSKGMALAETSGWYSSNAYWITSVPCFVRFGGVCTFVNSMYGGYYDGRADKITTFRPVIWNPETK